jgi:hypothetical protein
VVGCILLISACLFLLKFEKVQTFTAKRFAAYYSKQIGTQIAIDKIHIDLFGPSTLKGLYLEDLNGDTLLYASSATLQTQIFQWWKGPLPIDRISLSQAKVHIQVKDSVWNHRFLLDYLQGLKVNAPETQKPAKPLDLTFREIKLEEVQFKFSNHQRPARKQGIDFDHLELHDISGILQNIQLQKNQYKLDIKEFKFREKSGFALQSLHAKVMLTENLLECRDLYLRTTKSEVSEYVRFNFSQWADFRSFVDKVSIHLVLKNTRLNAEDIAYFAPTLRAHPFNTQIEGLFSGKVSDFEGKQVHLKTGSQTYLAGNIRFQGLPHWHQTQYSLQLNQLKSSSEDLSRLFPQWLGDPQMTLPAFVQKMGHLSYEGLLRGTHQTLHTDGRLTTGLGDVQALADFDWKGIPQYSGRFIAHDVKLDVLSKQRSLGKSSFDLVIEGEHWDWNKMKSSLSGHIQSFDFQNYRYQQLQVEGLIQQKWFAGIVEINDPELQLHFEGDLLLDPQSPELNFEAQVHKANFHALQWLKTDTLILENLHLKSKLKGPSYFNLEGTLHARDGNIFINQTPYALKEIDLEAIGLEDNRQVRLESDFVDLRIKGKVDFPNLKRFSTALLHQYIPQKNLEGEIGDQDFTLNVQFKNFHPFAQLWQPELGLDSGTNLYGHFSTNSLLDSLQILAPQIRWEGLHFTHAEITQSPQNAAQKIDIRAEELTFLQWYALKNIHFNTLWHSGQASPYALTAVDSNRLSLDLKGMMHIPENQVFSLDIARSHLQVNDKIWHFLPYGKVDIDRQKVHLSQLGLQNQDQQIVLEGTLSQDPEDRLKGQFEDFDLAFFNPFIQHTGIQLSGSINGQSTWNNVLKRPNAVADMRIDHIVMNGIEVGDMSIGAVYEPSQQLANVLISIHRDQTQTFSARGTYNAHAEVDKLQLNARFDKTQLAIFQPVLRHLVGDITGQVSADLRITGSIQHPKFNGMAQLHDARFKVLYLNTPYTINDQVRLENTAFVFEDMSLHDMHKHVAKVNGRVDLKNILVPYIDTRIETNNFMVLNTTRQHNSLYYGTAYGTGIFTFKGPTNAMGIEIKARTNANTRFTIPLNAMGMLNELDFIRFVGAQQNAVEKLAPTQFAEGLNMRMDLQLTPDAETQIFTDLGELTGRGEGNIVLQISSLGDFEMFGNYGINSGKFTFTAQDYINKIFEINRGGSIRWTGRPTEATVKLTASYEQRTSLSPLYNAAGRPDNEQRVLAQALMNLDGQLLQPDITFDINFPADPYVKDELQSYLSDVNNVNQQALSLILRRSFSPGSTTDFSREINNTLLSAGTELAFNQLNNLIAQSLNLNFVDLNIKSLNDASASFRFFNDRLVFTGGVTDRRNQQLNDLNVFSNRIATDAELLYLIRRDGRLVLRGSNRLNSRHFLLNPTDEYISALGLIYRQEFNTFGEFFRRMLIFGPPRQKPKEEEEKGQNN